MCWRFRILTVILTSNSVSVCPPPFTVKRYGVRSTLDIGRSPLACLFGLGGFGNLANDKSPSCISKLRLYITSYRLCRMDVKTSCIIE